MATDPFKYRIWHGKQSRRIKRHTVLQTDIQVQGIDKGIHRIHSVAHPSCFCASVLVNCTHIKGFNNQNIRYFKVYILKEGEIKAIGLGWINFDTKSSYIYNTRAFVFGVVIYFGNRR